MYAFSQSRHLESARRGALLSVAGLSIFVADRERWAPVVRDVSFTVEAGEMLGIVGESGSGKSLTCLALMGLLPAVARKTGAIDLRHDLHEGENQRADRNMAMIFQDPVGTLNPVKTIGSHLCEALAIHQNLKGNSGVNTATELLERVHIREPRRVMRQYPHQLSGGMNQRVGIALALAAKPKILIADEPTTALDVRTQREILNIIDDLRRHEGLGVVMVTHDLSIIAERADKVLVLYGGVTVEYAQYTQVFQAPRHPYLASLSGTIPNLDDARASLPTIEGSVPLPGDETSGCRFAARCSIARPSCQDQAPIPRTVSAGHVVACHFPLTYGAAR